MLIWFAGLGALGVWMVFRSPSLDYRLVAVGTVVPLVDGFSGGVWVGHTLVGSVTMLTVVIVGTRGRRLRRRRLIGVPIGTFVHLVLDGVWASTETFWWPFFGVAFDTGLPELDRPVALLVAMELAGVAALAWCWQRFGLAEPGPRARFLRSGQLPRGAAGRAGGN